MNIEEQLYNDHSIDPELYYLIKQILPAGKTILELGSGEGTAVLAARWNVISVESDSKYVGLYHDNYIYAPLKPHKAVRNHLGEAVWFDPHIMKSRIPNLEYDFLLIDGPDGSKRQGVIKYWDLFKQDVPIIVDDVSRRAEYKIAVSLSNKLGRPFCVYNAWNSGTVTAKYEERRIVNSESGKVHFALIPGVGGVIPAEIVCK